MLNSNCLKERAGVWQERKLTFHSQSRSHRESFFAVSCSYDKSDCISSDDRGHHAGSCPLGRVAFALCFKIGSFPLDSM